MSAHDYLFWRRSRYQPSLSWRFGENPPPDAPAPEDLPKGQVFHSKPDRTFLSRAVAVAAIALTLGGTAVSEPMPVGAQVVGDRGAVQIRTDQIRHDSYALAWPQGGLATEEPLLGEPLPVGGLVLSQPHFAEQRQTPQVIAQLPPAEPGVPFENLPAGTLLCPSWRQSVPHSIGWAFGSVPVQGAPPQGILIPTQPRAVEGQHSSLRWRFGEVPGPDAELSPRGTLILTQPRAVEGQHSSLRWRFGEVPGPDAELPPPGVINFERLPRFLAQEYIVPRIAFGQFPFGQPPPERLAKALIAPLFRLINEQSATVTRVSASISTVTLLAANDERRMAIIYNDSTANLYVKFGVGASTTSFTIKLAQDQWIEFPLPVYSGVVTGVWSAVDGAACITEIT